MSRIPTSSDRRLTRLGTALLIVSSLFTAGGAPAAAQPATHDAGHAGCQIVHAGPQQSASGSRRSYFQLRLHAGDARRARVVLANPEAYPCSVTLQAASGETAVNSGDTYPVPAAGCVETSCWLDGLPATVWVGAHGRRSVPFSIAVPASTPPGQYLAGVVIRATDPPSRPSPAGSKQVAVAVSARVALGVAVVVPGRQNPGLAIQSVRLDVHASVPMLYVTVRNTGNTWEHPAGGAVITADGTNRAFGIRASTVLAGDTAVLPLPAPGVARGSWTTRIELQYGDHQVAAWHGRLSFPTPRSAAAGTTAGSTAGSSERSHAVPGWLYAVVVALGGLVLLLVVALLLVVRRRRGDARQRVADERPADDAPALADASSR